MALVTVFSTRHLDTLFDAGKLTVTLDVHHRQCTASSSTVDPMNRSAAQISAAMTGNAGFGPICSLF